MLVQSSKYLFNLWRSGNILRGDTLLLHSDIRQVLRNSRRLNLNIAPKDIFDSLIEYLGPCGTLLLPLFNFGFANGAKFDINLTKSEMGTLSEIGRNKSHSIRTGHPIYSFAVIGKHDNLFKEVDNFSGYGVDSPFSILHKLNGKIAVLNLPDQKSMTFYHYVEEFRNVHYRYHKKFSGDYVDSNGNVTRRTYSLFVRNLDMGVATDVNRMGDRLWNLGLYKGNMYNQNEGLRSIETASLFNEVDRIILSGESINYLYKIV
jgi:aminoglycoside 3-N-acetyltransferase